MNLNMYVKKTAVILQSDDLLHNENRVQSLSRSISPSQLLLLQKLKTLYGMFNRKDQGSPVLS